MNNRSRREFLVDSAKITSGVICAATLGYDFMTPLESAAAGIDFIDSNMTPLHT